MFKKLKAADVRKSGFRDWVLGYRDWVLGISKPYNPEPRTQNLNPKPNTLIIYLFAIMILQQVSYGQFGKNKVQYQEFNWKYIESKHFDVYYNDGSKELADFTAIEAEISLLSIQRTLNYKLNSRISLVVYNSHNEFQQTNVVWSYMPEGVGGVTEMLKNRVVVPFQGNYAQFAHVIHHELVHAVVNEMFYGGTLQSSVSVNAFQLPLWMSEGLAEYESFGGLDIGTDQYMRDITISQYLPNLERLDNYLAYRAGQTFYWYVAKNYGAERVGDLLNKIRIYGKLDPAFMSCFKMNFEDFSNKWEKDLKKMFWPDLEIFKSPEDFATALTNHKKEENFYNTSPAISPDGEKVAYIADKDGLFGVFITGFDKKEKPRQLVSSFREQDFEQLNILTPGISWSPDGKKLAISAKAGGEDAIFIVDAASGDYEKIKFGFKSISSVVWSPDGNYMSFVASDQGKSDVYLYNLSTNNYDNLTDDIYSDFHPTWSPDCKKLYFISDRDMKYPYKKMWQHNLNSSDVFSIDISTKEIKRITFDEQYTKSSLAVTPGGDKLLFVSNKNGIGNIYELEFATGVIKPKTNSIAEITHLSLAKDASKLVFAVQNGGGYDVFYISFPMEKKLDIETLPLTKLRKLINDEENSSLAAKEIEDSTIQDKSQPKSYGNFAVDFSRQQVVTPSKDTEIHITDNLVKSKNLTSVLSDTVFAEHDYKIKFSTDLVMGNPGYSNLWSVQGIAQFLFSDVLGDHQIFLQANLLFDLQNSSIFATYNYLPKLIDYSVSLYHSAILIYIPDLTDPNNIPDPYLFRFRNMGITGGASLPLDFFNRFEGTTDFMYVSKQNLDIPTDPIQSSTIIAPGIRYVHDDVLYGNFAPERGTRLFVGIKASPKIGADGVGFATVSGDVREYIKFWDYLGLAVRGAFAGSFGPDPQRYALGGTENWLNFSYNRKLVYLKNPQDFAFMHDRFVYPLRGFMMDEIEGSKYFLVNAELRFPLFRALLAGPIPILFQGIGGSFFFDIGGAWNDKFNAVVYDDNGQQQLGNLRMSMGIGIRTYFLGLPWKIDIAWPKRIDGWTSSPEYLFSLGFDF